MIWLQKDSKSPKSAKKFIYPAKKSKYIILHQAPQIQPLSCTERSSRHVDELMATAGVPKGPVENKPGDTSILRVIEAYCASGKTISNIRECTYIHSEGGSVSECVCVCVGGGGGGVQCFLQPTKSLTTKSLKL